MRYTNRLNLPDALVRAVASASDEYDRGDAAYTVTELIGPPRIAALRRLHEEELVVDVADCIYAAEGTAFHTLMEKSERMGMSEKRMYCDFEGTRISGKFDLLHLNDVGLLQDYKRTSVYSVLGPGGVEPKFEWEAQLNILDYILTRNEMFVKELEIVPVFRDWLKSRARIDKSYPQTQSIRIPVQRWSEVTKENFIRDRIRLHQAARSGTLPECTREERWIKDDTWKVYKGDNKRAMNGGVFKGPDAEDLARALAATTPGTRVEFVSGEATRCIDWCPVSQWCSQWQRELREAGGAPSA